MRGNEQPGFILDKITLIHYEFLEAYLYLFFYFYITFYGSYVTRKLELEFFYQRFICIRLRTYLYYGYMALYKYNYIPDVRRFINKLLLRYHIFGVRSSSL